MPSKKILVADDEKDIVFLIKTFLEEKNYQVLEAFDGKQTLKEAREEKPDLILLDIMMPEMNGITVNRQLKTEPQTKNIPIIVITGRGETRKTFRKKTEAKIDVYLEKPFTLELLLRKINEVLGEK